MGSCKVLQRFHCLYISKDPECHHKSQDVWQEAENVVSQLTTVSKRYDAGVLAGRTVSKFKEKEWQARSIEAG